MPVSPTQVQALASMRRWLADGAIHGGEALPSEFALAERLRVSRGTVRKVLATLAGEGLIGARTRGRRIRQPGAAGGAADQAVVVLGSGVDDRDLAETQEGSVEDGLLRALHEQGSAVLLVDGSRTLPTRALAVLGRKPSGIVCTQFVARQPRWREQVGSWRASGIPVVVHSGDAAYAGFDRVCSDHAGGACELTRRLIAAGRRRIRQVWHTADKPSWLLEREAGHARAMAEAGLAVAPPICIPEEPARSPGADPANLELRARAYLGFLFEPLQGAEAPDALIAVNDTNAASVVAACRMLGRAVHGQIAVAGFDANWDISWEWPALGLAPVLSANKRNHRVGRALAEVLAERIAGRAGPGPIVRLLPVEVVDPLSR